MRIRTIKPEFWSHPVLSSLDDGARLLAIGLLNYADDEGYFLCHATLVRNALRPFDEDSASTRKAIETLAKVGWIEIKEHSEQGKIGKIVNFLKHQRIDRPTASKLATYFVSTNPRRVLVEDSPLEGKGKEGIRERNREGFSSSDPDQLPGVELPSAGETPKPADRYTEARIVLHALNEAAGRHYRETQANLDFIRARLAEPDVTVDGCLAMVHRQVARWGKDPKMVEFLRPETLFNRTKFDAYYAARSLPLDTSTGPRQQPTPADVRNDGIAGIDEWERQRNDRIAATDRSAPPPGFERKPELAGEGVRHG